MSFDLRLTAPRLDDDAAHRLQKLVSQEGAWPLQVHGGWVSVPESDGDEDFFTHTDTVGGRFVWRSPAGVGERLARSFELLARECPDGFSFHAAWSNAGPDRERAVSVADLAALARAGGIDEDTLYRVQTGSSPPGLAATGPCRQCGGTGEEPGVAQWVARRSSSHYGAKAGSSRVVPATERGSSRRTRGGVARRSRRRPSLPLSAPSPR